MLVKYSILNTRFQIKLFDLVSLPEETFTQKENSILDKINVQKILKKSRINTYFLNKEILRPIFFCRVTIGNSNVFN